MGSLIKEKQKKNLPTSCPTPLAWRSPTPAIASAPGRQAQSGKAQGTVFPPCLHTAHVQQIVSSRKPCLAPSGAYQSARGMAIDCTHVCTFP